MLRTLSRPFRRGVRHQQNSPRAFVFVGIGRSIAAASALDHREVYELSRFERHRHSCNADCKARTCSLSGPQALRKETEVSLNGNGGTALTQSERNIGHRWFELVWNQGRRDAIAQMLAPDALLHDGGVDSSGPEAFYPLFDRLSATFSKIHVDVHHALAEGDQVCVRWTFTGTHTGDGLGVAPTGVTVRVTGICILRVADDRIVEGWQNWDMMGMMEQITGVTRSLATYIG